MDIHIELSDLGLFLSIVIVGASNGFYMFKKGLKKGWDNAIFTLEDEGYLLVNDDGEVRRVTDKEYREYKESLSYSD